MTALQGWRETGWMVAIGYAAHEIWRLPLDALAFQPVSKAVQWAVDELEKEAASTVQVHYNRRPGTNQAAKCLIAEIEAPAKIERVCLQCLRQIGKVARPWEKITAKTGFWILSHEFIFGLTRHLGRDRALSDDLIWGAVRGLFGGAAMGANYGGDQWKMHLAFGAFAGIGFGVVGSAAGSVVGDTLRCACKIVGHDPGDCIVFRFFGSAFIVSMLKLLREQR